MGRKMLVYVGTYTDGQSDGIYSLRMDVSDGSLGSAELSGKARNPSFLVPSPSGRFLYAVGELATFEGRQSGVVSAFEIADRSGKLRLLNRRQSGGAAPCYVTTDESGGNVLVANYDGGSVSVLPVGPDGRLDEPSCVVRHESDGAACHAHSINVDPSGRFALAADLGLDEVLVYRFDAAQGRLSPNNPPAVGLPLMTGPRHLAFHPNGQLVYVINETASTITVFDYDPKRGALSARQTVSTLPPGFAGTSATAEIRVNPSGEFLYGSNRGHDSLVVFAIDSTGALTLIGHEPTRGRAPRHFTIDPSGQFLLAANRRSDTVVVFRIDRGTGKLIATGSIAQVPCPVCVTFLPLRQ